MRCLAICLLFCFPTAVLAGELYWPETGARPDWCAAAMNVCISVADSAERTPEGAPRHSFLRIARKHPDVTDWRVQFEQGEHTVRIGYEGEGDVLIDGSGGVLNCLDSRPSEPDSLEWLACVARRVSTGGTLTLRNMTIKGGDPVRGRYVGHRGFRSVFVRSRLLIENVTFDGCSSSCLQGKAEFDWTLRRVRTGYPAALRGAKYGHFVYSLSKTPSDATLRIEDSDLATHAGHVVKTGHRRTEIIRTVLREGTGDTGAAVHSHSNETVILNDVTVYQPPSAGNDVVFLVGPRPDRCRGDAEKSRWVLNRVRVFDSMRHFWGAVQARTEAGYAYRDPGGEIVYAPGPGPMITQPDRLEPVIGKAPGVRGPVGDPDLPFRPFLTRCPVDPEVTISADSAYWIRDGDHTGPAGRLRKLDVFPQSIHDVPAADRENR